MEQAGSYVVRSISLFLTFTTMRFLFFLACCIYSGPASSQPELPAAFTELLSQLEVHLALPDEARFRLKRSPENDYLQDQLTVYSKEEKLEMRFYLVPENEHDIYYQRPHMRTSLLVVNLGSNAEDAVTTVHSFDEEELAVLNADWARMYTFRPKSSYSPYAHAQLIATYRAGRGLACSILLFDQAPGSLEDRQLTLRFD